jgi:hypothetical protein
MKNDETDLRFSIEWTDYHRPTKHAAHPDFPHGIDIDVSRGAAKTCTVPLPYPAKGCGYYAVECAVCGLTVGMTTAGRPDDPRSIKVPCKLKALQ